MGRSMNKLEQKIKFVISYFTGHAYYPDSHVAKANKRRGNYPIFR